MKRNFQKLAAVAALVFSVTAFGQIKEERLILNKKREPEVKKIEKKKTSVETVKNYPPEQKSQDPVNYEITNVPAVSDFKTSTIQGEDISPKFGSEYRNNYLQFGMGNYGKILFDGNASYLVNEKLEVGADAHVISTNGLKDDYPWSSRESNAEVGAFLNSYGEKGKINLNTAFNSHNYNYYGIYALSPASNIDVKQKVQNFKINGHYDYYTNHIINDIRLKTSFLSDEFDAKETHAALDLNLSEHGIAFPLENTTLNVDLGLGVENLKSNFQLLTNNESSYFEAKAIPKLTFFRGNSYLMLGSGFSYLNGEYFNDNMVGKYSEGKTFWFPRAEIFIGASPLANLYFGVDGGLQHNSYESMLAENPYAVSDQLIRPTRTKYRIYFGLKGDANQMVKYDLSAGISKMDDIMFFRGNGLFNPGNTLDRYGYDYANTFSAVYDDGTLTEVRGALQYFPLANLTLEAEAKYQNYKLNHYSQIYNKPVLQALVGAKYSMLDKKLLLGAQGLFASHRYTNYFEITPDPALPNQYLTNEVQNSKLDGYADLNLSAEYQFHKNFSIFALGNNLFGKKYEVQKGYKVLGAQILGGIKFKF